MKKWGSKLISSVGLLLIIAAIYIFVKPHAENYFFKKENDEKVENYDKQNKDNSKFDKEIPKDKSKMVGYISVPDANIKTPVYPGHATAEQLERGVSFAEGEESLKDQNIAIAGHTQTGDSDYQFSNLKKSSKGSKVYFKVRNKNMTYEITKIFDVKPEDVEVLNEQQSDQQQLTLITCDNYIEQTGEWEDRKIFVAEAV